ncbi:MAG: hypothetical protein NUW22_07150, partial [Acidobacteria bacterium]|nr:hypothetical protein [Acidobacteriota bacterium]
VVYAYVRYCLEHTPSSARLFAISLSVLFFTKYNYFLLLIGPLVIYEWLEHTTGDRVGQRLFALARWARRIVTSPTGALVALYVVGLLLIYWTGGVEFRLFGQRISVRSVGNSGHIVLYVLLARLWYRHRRGRIDWTHLVSTDPRVRPLLVWFVAPVTVWMASPYPNHIRGFANLVINRPMGDATLGAGLSTYTDALRTSYFYNEWVLVSVMAVFAVAAMRYRRHAAPMQWLILTIPIQFAVIALHQTRFPRFLLLTVVLLCLVAASEVGRWCAASDRRRRAGSLLAPAVLAAGLVASNSVVTEERFRVVAFELYSDSEPLRSALSSIRTDLTPSDRLAVVGQRNDLSPALFRWELGPPSGVPCFPFELAGAQKLDLALATRVLLIEPDGPDSTLDDVSYYATQRHAVLERVARGELALRREFPVPDLRVNMKLYARTSPPEREARCR